MWESLPPGTPTYIPIIIVIAGAVLTLSERLAKIRGPLGALARWWQDRQLREVDQRISLDQKIQQVVDLATKQLRDDLDSLRKDLDDEKEARRRERVEHRRELAENERALDKAMSWIAVATAWYADHLVWLAAQGIEVSEPLPSWFEWRVDSE